MAESVPAHSHGSKGVVLGAGRDVGIAAVAAETAAHSLMLPAASLFRLLQ
eukprot:CAMPEP_0206590480 /NCGR_PEP_ID=MMETSP0325_2-20121206/39652_1 /ASSEMBLY_ACC=CAM_ASM_000347 /TAXON_ID=2866 /ORGANISM="Crypthecodinium cohnii, Strain Seligo" /LENGTH=49 /DNA_ID= /DNA_START= /DNA_END= /DNA_ORIENTATION=